MKKRNILEKPYKILIVDDDPVVVKTLERLLYKRNYLFYSVQSGEEAIMAVQDINPDLILLDVFMSEMNGYDVCEKLKKKGITQKIPVIFLTSNNASKDIVKGFNAGAVDYILKPFNTEELIARVNTQLELKRSREEIKQMELIKTRFFNILANDIRDSLTGVKGVAEFLHQELESTQVNINESKKLSGILKEDSAEIFNFVDKIIKWNVFNSEPNELLIQEFPAKELIQEILAGFRDYLSQKEMVVSLQVPEDAVVKSDKNILKNILTEVIDNAIKYSTKKGKIVVTVKPGKDGQHFIIKDHGVGMGKDVANNVFRLDTPHPKTIGTHQEKGVGLGLVICQTLIDKISGHISVESEKYKGTQIQIEVPFLE